MTSNRLIYIFTGLLTAFLATGCIDDSLYDDANPVGNPNAVTFEAGVGIDAVLSRSGENEKKLYDPLELTDESGSQTLYLHTCDSEVIGETARDILCNANDPATRGQQVKNIDDLVNYNTNFKVHAQYQHNAEEYIEWTNGNQWATDKKIWITDRTRYWPGQQMLTFHAVSPASEFADLKSMRIANNEQSFSYTAKKGTSANRDAESQKDLMIATTICNKQGSVEGRAPLNFHHALAAVKFAVRDVLNGEVTNIKIKGVYGAGDCVFNADDSGNNGAFAWSNQSGLTDYSQNFNYVVTDRDGYITSDDDSRDLVLNDKMPEKTFMLIPQMIPDGAEIEVTMINRKVVSGSGAPTSITVKARIDQNSLKEWKAGHEYIYTISTSKDNWVYVLTATGNHKLNTNTHNVDGNQIYVYAPDATEFDTYGEKAYFKVTSYRYRANDVNIKEKVAWTASHDDARGYRDPDGNIYDAGDSYAIKKDVWIKDPLNLKGDGGTTPEQHDLQFADHYSMTTWDGDEWMQKQTQRGTKSAPWDLSTAGGAISRTTANSYVIDRGGWYMFPIVYGNMIENGAYNESSIKFKGTKLTSLTVTGKQGDVTYSLNYRYLNTFTDYAGSTITSTDGFIPIDSYNSAHLIWSDVYNGVENVDIFTKGGKKYVRFYVPSENIQQGNTVIGICTGDKLSGSQIVWSWHIWFTEHWLNPTSGKSNAYEEDANIFTKYNAAMGGSGMRERGDVQTAKNLGISGYKYHISPYNVGWCDSKMVDYLQRPGTMTFVQKGSGKTVKLPILQKGTRIDYKFGNNVYFQFGRKDPFIGFVDHSNNVKRSFGPKLYAKAKQPTSINEGILNPNVMYCSGTGQNNNANKNPLNDWLSGNPYVNLWNNSGTFILAMTGSNTGQWTDKALFVSTKTVYDPCPPGYMTPPAAVWKITGGDVNGKYDAISFTDSKLPTGVKEEVVNGDTRYIIYASSTQNNNTKLWFTGTGHRWYSDDASASYKGGDNFNPHLAYLWSSMSSGRFDRTGLGLALGKDGSGYGVCSFFFGRRSMARPVRAIRQVYAKP